MSDQGLYVKYIVFDAETEQQVEGFCFVLRPEKDPAARSALRAYATTTTNRALRHDLEDWLIKHPKLGSAGLGEPVVDF